ncbi:MAG: hypothetical protein U0793_01525 [Gemmataceae bacterium]
MQHIVEMLGAIGLFPAAPAAGCTLKDHRYREPDHPADPSIPPQEQIIPPTRRTPVSEDLS